MLGPKNQFEEFLDTLKDTGAVNIGTIEKNAKQSNFIVAVGDNDSKHENHIEGHESNNNKYTVDTHQGNSYVSQHDLPPPARVSFIETNPFVCIQPQVTSEARSVTPIEIHSTRAGRLEPTANEQASFSE